jgi:hypothetical protein
MVNHATKIPQSAIDHREVARRIGLDIGKFGENWHCIFQNRVDARAHRSPTDAWRTAALIATREQERLNQLR